MFANPAVDALWCVPGRLRRARAAPRCWIGTSHPRQPQGARRLRRYHRAAHGAARRRGWVSFHGPVAARGFAGRTRSLELRRVLWSDSAPASPGRAAARAVARGRVSQENRVTTLAPGRSAGPTPRRQSLPDGASGGDMLPDLRGAILFLEEVDEPSIGSMRFLTLLALGRAGRPRRDGLQEAHAAAENTSKAFYVQNRVLGGHPGRAAARAGCPRSRASWSGTSTPGHAADPAVSRSWTRTRGRSTLLEARRCCGMARLGGACEPLADRACGDLLLPGLEIDGVPPRYPRPRSRPDRHPPAARRCAGSPSASARRTSRPSGPAPPGSK